VNRLAAFIGLCFCAAATVMAASFAADNFDNPSAVLRLPLSVLYGALVVGFALMTWRSAQAMLGQRWEDPWAA
jgi:TRAP-type C4-dicarboxylate transport system permease small subunit